MDRHFIIDFDSTITQVEALEELAKIALKEKKGSQDIITEIAHITNLGMEGKIPIPESLQKRLSLLNANRKHLDELVKVLKKKISPSFKRNKNFFKKYGNHVYVFSAGFSEFINPVAKELHIPQRNIYANTFKFDEKGNIIGFDQANVLAQKGGKGELLKQLNLKGEVYVIGDGYTDWEMKNTGLVTKFFAFTENIARQTVIEKADHIVPSFDEFLYINHLPMSLSYPKNRIKVLLLENIHPNAIALFKKEGYSVETYSKSLDEEDLCKKIKDVSFLGIRSKTEITQKIIDAAPKLLVIGAFCIGTNQIDLQACTKRGICVFNAPYSNTRSVVELVIGEMIVLMRGIVDKSTKLHQAQWDKSAKNSNEVRGKTLGIVGYGNIGAQLSVIAEALGMHVLYYDVVEKLALGNAQKCHTLPELLKKSDVITIHVDGNPANRHMISEKEFKQMKQGAVFINLSRGFVVDIAALANAIKSGKIRGAAIDVFPYEPKGNDEKFISELQGLPNVILTPHIGGSTEEAQQNIAHFVGKNAISFINTGTTSFSVNFPQIQLQEMHHSHRFIHIHENTAGILASINHTLSAHKANIMGQYLKTNDHIGYVITDVDKKYDTNVIKDLKKIPKTIRFRVLY